MILNHDAMKSEKVMQIALMFQSRGVGRGAARICPVGSLITAYRVCCTRRGQVCACAKRSVVSAMRHVRARQSPVRSRTLDQGRELSRD